MKKPKVSVLLGVLNQEDYLSACIESVLAQTFSDFEFIILNDGSTDCTWEIIQEYAKKDSRIRPFSFPEKQGIAVGCNFTVAQAKGDYLARIDGDDIWKPEKLEKQMAYLEEHPECGVCFTQAEIMDGQGKIVHGAECDFMDELFAQPNRSQSQWLRKLFIDGNCFVHSSSVIRKNCFDAIDGYRNALRQLPDYDLWLQLIQITEFFLIPEKLMQYRWYAGNTSIPDSVGSCRTHQEYFQIYLHVFDKTPLKLFCDSFAEHLRGSLPTCQEELDCEKAFLLLDHSAGILPEVGRLAALTHFTRLLNEEKTRKLLDEKYHFNTFDYIELESEPLFFTTPLLYPTKQLIKNIQTSTASLFYSQNEYFDADHSIQAVYRADYGIQRFQFELPEAEIKTLRFDPLEGYGCVVWYFQAKLNGKPLTAAPANAQQTGVWCFTDRDPQIILHLEGAANGSLEIIFGVTPLMDIVFQDITDMDSSVSISKQRYQHLEQQNQTLVEQNKHLQETLDLCTADRDALRAQLDRIYQTSAYRAYAKVKHLIKK